ncbi:MAG: tRNA (adenosine(37)-N6)-dimethylallyltransferase MiaA [candidate division WOR-3 bacterium]|nr:MAG: tRNA (adenosine(37)-N6)-dimethylallyltransferase MiaA [candidate division WOR-3 bacterium]
MHLLTIVGPTSVGKTAVVIELTLKISGEIISADSRQIYKNLDIGTAKPDARQRKKVKFHLIDFVSPDENYSCGQFARDAGHAITDIRFRGLHPVVCGGTGLYIKSLFHPLDDLPRSDKNTKERLRKMLEEKGTDYMYRRLSRIDPEWAQGIKPNDKQRILRGLEVYEITGRALSKSIGGVKKSPFLPYYIGLKLPRKVLYRRIDRRFDEMIRAGLLEEVESLLQRGYSPQSGALRTIGYKEMIEYCQGRIPLDEAIERAKRRTRNYAKRQITWFSKIPGMVWYDADSPNVIEIILKNVRKARIV